MSKILVTGGAGFIGSHIVDAYIDASHEVIVIDDLSTGDKKNLNLKAKFYEADITNLKRVTEIFEEEKPEIVNHHAAQVSVTQSQKNPSRTTEVNYKGTFNLINQPGIKRFIFASTGGAMFSSPEQLPATEITIANPLSNYGVSKLSAENTVRDNARRKKFPYVVLRYSNVFGPRQNPHGESGVIAIFCELASTDMKPTIFNERATRDYVYVRDVARANLLALEKGNGEIINIGTGTETTNQEVYEAVAKEFSWKQKPVYKPARPGELERSVLAIGKAKQILGWQPKVTIAKGLQYIHAR